MKEYDVTVSVWNRFHSAEQCAGFKRNGLKTHWVGNTRPPEGADKHTFLVASWLALRIHFATQSECMKRLSRLLFNKASVRYFDRTKVVWAYMEYNNRLLEACRQNGIPAILDVPIGEQRECKRILYQAFGEYNQPCPQLPSEKWIARYQKAYQTADWLVVGSSFVKDTLKKSGIKEQKILLNPYGVDIKFWSENSEVSSLSAEKLVFVFTGSVSLRKGMQYILKAWKHLNPQNAELLICGDYYLPGHPDFCDLPESVKFLGRKTHLEIREIYRRAHVYLLPSLFEGLARSGIEAMAAGLPPVVTWESGLTDFVKDGENGWIVPSRDADALAIALAHIIAANLERIQEMGGAAQDAVRHLTWENYGDRCSVIVRDVIANSNKSKI